MVHRRRPLPDVESVRQFLRFGDHIEVLAPARARERGRRLSMDLAERPLRRPDDRCPQMLVTPWHTYEGVRTVIDMTADADIVHRVSRLENDTESIYEILAEIKSTQDEHNRRFVTIDQRFDAMDQRFDTLERRFDGMEKRMDSMDQRFDTLEGRFDALEGRFDTLERRFDGMEGRFDTLEGRFDGMEKRFDAMDQRMDALDRRFDTLEGRFDTIEAAVTEVIRRLPEPS